MGRVQGAAVPRSSAFVRLLLLPCCQFTRWYPWESQPLVGQDVPAPAPHDPCAPSVLPCSIGCTCAYIASWRAARHTHRHLQLLKRPARQQQRQRGRGGGTCRQRRGQRRHAAAGGGERAAGAGPPAAAGPPGLRLSLLWVAATLLRTNPCSTANARTTTVRVDSLFDLLIDCVHASASYVRVLLTRTCACT